MARLDKEDIEAGFVCDSCEIFNSFGNSDPYRCDKCGKIVCARCYNDTTELCYDCKYEMEEEEETNKVKGD